VGGPPASRRRNFGARLIRLRGEESRRDRYLFHIVLSIARLSRRFPQPHAANSKDLVLFFHRA
jgi:hypothetical protein